MSAAIPPAYNAGKRKKEEAREWKDREKGRAERDKRDVRKQYMYICMHTWARKDAKEGGHIWNWNRNTPPSNNVDIPTIAP